MKEDDQQAAGGENDEAVIDMIVLEDGEYQTVEVTPVGYVSLDGAFAECGVTCLE